MPALSERTAEQKLARQIFEAKREATPNTKLASEVRKELVQAKVFDESLAQTLAQIYRKYFNTQHQEQHARIAQKTLLDPAEFVALVKSLFPNPSDIRAMDESSDTAVLPRMDMFLQTMYRCLTEQGFEYYWSEYGLLNYEVLQLADDTVNKGLAEIDRKYDFLTVLEQPQNSQHTELIHHLVSLHLAYEELLITIGFKSNEEQALSIQEFAEKVAGFFIVGRSEITEVQLQNNIYSALASYYNQLGRK